MMNKLPKQIETACTRGPRYAGSIESAELELVVKYIGFGPHPGEEHHGYYGKHSSHSHRV